MKRKRTFSALLVITALLISSGTAALAESRLGIDGPCYPVISPANAADTMSVVWWDAPETITGTVQYSDMEFANDEAPEGVRSAQGRITRTDTSNGYTVFEADMTGLSGETVYYYRVGNEGAWSEISSFTASSGSGEAAFMFFGDPQFDDAAAAAAWGELVLSAYAKNPDAAFSILGGDLVNGGQTSSDWQQFMEQATRLFSGHPMLAVPGNHDSNSTSGKPALYLQLLAMPQNGPEGFKEEFYSYDYGDCHIVALSSQILSGGQLRLGSMSQEDFQRIEDWIRADLAASDARWKIVVMHHPAYVVVSDSVSAEVLENWVPLFEEAQVDLVLCGHQHVYMRTGAINGVTYVMGNSGSKHDQTVDVDHAEVMLGEASNYQAVRTSGNSLTLECFSGEGTLLDSVTLAAKDRTVTPGGPGEGGGGDEGGEAGDINGDGLTNSEDVELILSAIRLRRAYSVSMDINGDGVVNICDAHLLALQIAA